MFPIFERFQTEVSTYVDCVMHFHYPNEEFFTFISFAENKLWKPTNESAVLSIALLRNSCAITGPAKTYLLLQVFGRYAVYVWIPHDSIVNQ